jgi:virulence factor
MYQQLSSMPGRHLILMQKNRLFQPAALRQFVFDDFIHVIDTLLFLAPGPIKEMAVNAKIVAGLTYCISLQLIGDNYNAIGIMNRDSGITEETLEVMCPGQKWRVNGMHTTTHFSEGQEILTSANDWESHLHRRGFPQIIEHFINAVRTRMPAEFAALNAMESHAMCEKVVIALT